MAGSRLRRFERFDGFTARGDRIATSVAIGTALEARFGTFEERARFGQLIGGDAFGSRVASCTNRLASVAHLLHWRTGTCGQREAHEDRERVQAMTKRYGVEHELAIAKFART